MKKRMIAALLSGMVAVGGIAYAQAPAPAGAPPPHGLFERLDSNKDGVVTRAEVKAEAERHFDALDVNHDGTITQSDRDALRTSRLDERFANMDTDKNGQISRAEFGAAHEAKAGEFGKGPDGWRMGPGHGGHHHGMEAKGGPDGAPGLKADITKADFVARPLAMFDRVDTNHDAKVTAAERDAAKARMRDMRGHGMKGHGMHDDSPDAPPPADAPARP